VTTVRTVIQHRKAMNKPRICARPFQDSYSEFTTIAVHIKSFNKIFTPKDASRRAENDDLIFIPETFRTRKLSTILMKSKWRPLNLVFIHRAITIVREPPFQSARPAIWGAVTRLRRILRSTQWPCHNPCQRR
jgi:hypothetical protein